MAQRKGILGFKDKYRFLSNFFPCDIPFEGKIYPSVEHAYQAAKTLDPVLREEIRTAATAGKAKKLGQTLNLRPDWDRLKFQVMEELLDFKFAKPELKDKLLATDDLYIEETNHWNDTVWGVCEGKGLNALGSLLMKKRNMLEENEKYISDFANGYDLAEYHFAINASLTNPFAEGSDAHRGYEEGVYDFTNK